MHFKFIQIIYENEKYCFVHYNSNTPNLDNKENTLYFQKSSNLLQKSPFISLIEDSKIQALFINFIALFIFFYFQ